MSSHGEAPYGLTTIPPFLPCADCATERDCCMTAEAACDYGIIDEALPREVWKGCQPLTPP